MVWRGSLVIPVQTGVKIVSRREGEVKSLSKVMGVGAGGWPMGPGLEGLTC